MDPIDREGERALTEYLSRHLLALHFPKQDKPEWRSAFYVSHKGAISLSSQLPSKVAGSGP